mgnify:CR=1 FL=1
MNDDQLLRYSRHILLDELGIGLSIDVPGEALPRVTALRTKGLKPLPGRGKVRP